MDKGKAHAPDLPSCSGCDQIWVVPQARREAIENFWTIETPILCGHYYACKRLTDMHGEAMQDDGR